MLEVRAPARESVRVLTAWAGLIVVAIVWGDILVHTGHRLDIAAPPFWSALDFHPSLRLVPAVVAGAAVVWFGPRLARRAPWPQLLVLVVVGATVWAVAVAYVDGARALTDPMSAARNDYLQTARQISSLPDFLSGFVSEISQYNQHTKGHPPGMIVFEKALLGLGAATDAWHASIVVAGGAAAAVASLVALRDVAGEAAARAVAPFMVLVPAVIWWQTADAFFAGVSAWAVTLVVLASGRDGPKADATAIAGGVLFGCTAFLSYGLVLLALLPLIVCVTRRTARPLILACAGAVPVFALFAVWGFWWVSGLVATRHEYWTGVAMHRPYSYFLVADLALFAIATGPATAVAMTRLRSRGAWLLVGGIVVVVALADLSGMSKAEVERIWLPFVPWAMLATAGFVVARLPVMRMWLALQATSTLIVAVTVWSQW